MALLFYDGFDWTSDIADITRKWNSANLTGCYVGTAYGRFGSKGLSLYYNRYIQKNIDDKSTVYLGLATYTGSGDISVSTSYPFIDFMNGANSHVALCFVSPTVARFYNNHATQIGTDITVPNIQGRWVYIEIKATISDTVGEIILKINGIEYYNGTNLDTRNGTPTTINSIRIATVYATSPNIDDAYIDDSQFHGDVRVRTIYPDANGSENDLTPSAGSNYQNVDDPGDPDDDSTYNSGSTVGDRDLYGVTAPTLATVKAVAVSPHIRKDDAGTRKIKNVVRSGGTNYLGSELEVDSSYGVKQSIWELDPADSTAWSKTKIDNAEFGLEITA